MSIFSNELASFSTFASYLLQFLFVVHFLFLPEELALQVDANAFTPEVREQVLHLGCETTAGEQVVLQRAEDLLELDEE
jgi:hypothetical protein